MGTYVNEIPVTEEESKFGAAYALKTAKALLKEQDYENLDAFARIQENYGEKLSKSQINTLVNLIQR